MWYTVTLYSKSNFLCTHVLKKGALCWANTSVNNTVSDSLLLLIFDSFDESSFENSTKFQFIFFRSRLVTLHSTRMGERFLIFCFTSRPRWAYWLRRGHIKRNIIMKTWDFIFVEMWHQESNSNDYYFDFSDLFTFLMLCIVTITKKERSKSKKWKGSKIFTVSYSTFDEPRE